MTQRPLILIVEDDTELAAVLAETLRKEGFSTRRERTGRDGLAAVAMSRPALLVLDMALPDITGMEVCRQLRRAESTHAVPIVFVNAQDTEIDRVLAFELGANDYVAKPYSQREMVLRIRARLREQQPDREPEKIASFEVVSAPKRLRGRPSAKPMAQAHPAALQHAAATLTLRAGSRSSCSSILRFIA